VYATAAPEPAPTPARGARAATLAFALAAALLLVVVAIRVERNVTWYLAVDQYGYLTFANDLMHGKVFHDWPLAGALRGRLPPKIDVLSQTYVYDNGRLYCRYAPGFPILLAAWMRVFGQDAVHMVNPLVFLALLGLALAYQARATRDRWRALVGTALIVLCPTFLHLWALTLVRDLSTHLAGLGGLFLLLPAARGAGLSAARTAAAGLRSGTPGRSGPTRSCTSSRRFLIAAWRWIGAGTTPARARARGLGRRRPRRPRRARARSSPTTTIATGSAFRPTQGMELDNFLPEPPPVPGRRAAAGAAGRRRPRRLSVGRLAGGHDVRRQGGGIRLRTSGSRCPGNVDLLRQSYGDTLLGLAVAGALLAMMQRPGAVPDRRPLLRPGAPLLQPVGAGRTGRYFSGVFVFVPMLIVEGCARAGRPGRAAGAPRTARPSRSPPGIAGSRR
jgi:hypothetical protein